MIMVLGTPTNADSNKQSAREFWVGGNQTERAEKPGDVTQEQLHYNSGRGGRKLRLQQDHYHLTLFFLSCLMVINIGIFLNAVW